MWEVSPVAFRWQLINRPVYTRRNVSQSKLSSPDCWMLELECPKLTDGQAVNWKIKFASLNYSKDPRLCSETFEECLPCSLGSRSVQQSCPATNWDVIRNGASPKSIKRLHWWAQRFNVIGLTGWCAAPPFSRTAASSRPSRVSQVMPVYGPETVGWCGGGAGDKTVILLP